MCQKVSTVLVGYGKSCEGEKKETVFLLYTVYHASYYDSTNILVEQDPVLSLLQHMHVARLVQYLQENYTIEI